METWRDALTSNPVFRREFPFQSRFLEVDGCEIHYVDEGAGPVLLLLHGNPTFSFLYRKIISGLRDRFRLIAPDLPGFGLSAARAGYDFKPQSHSRVVEAFARALGLKDVALFVQDWGGPVGLGFAGRKPDLIKALVVGNTWAWPVNGDLHFESFSRIMGGAIGRHFIVRNNAFVNLMMPAGTPKSRISPEILEIYRAALPPERRAASAIFPREILASREFLAETERGLTALKDKPALILWGNKDVAFRDKERRRFEALFASRRTTILDGAGHYIQEESPAEIVDAIRNWAPAA